MADMRTDIFLCGYLSIAFFDLSHYPDNKASTGYRKDIVQDRTAVPGTEKLSYNSSDKASGNTKCCIYPEAVFTFHDLSGNKTYQCTDQNSYYQ